MPASLVVESFEDVDCSVLKFPIFVIYDRPKDFPDKIVLRIWDVDKPTNVVMLFDDLGDARAVLPAHFVRIPRSVADDPIIVETYI